jgi:hypothetical protein
MKVVLAGLLLLLCAGCGGDDDGGERLAVFHLESAIGAPGEDGQLRCGPPQAVCPGIVEQPPPRAFRYPLLEEPALTDADVDRSSARRAEAETGESIVLVRLTPRGRGAFARLTKVVARIGGRDQAWHHFAVVVGDEIVAFPEVDFDAYPNGIVDAPDIRIEAPTEADARRLARRVRGE